MRTAITTEIELAQHAGVFLFGGRRGRMLGAEYPVCLVGGLAVERHGFGGLPLKEPDQSPVRQGRYVIGMFGAPGAADAPLVLVGQRLGLGEAANVGAEKTKVPDRVECVGMIYPEHAPAAKPEGSAGGQRLGLVEIAAACVAALRAGSPTRA